MSLKNVGIALLLTAALACNQEKAAQTDNKVDDATSKAAAKVADALDDVGVPLGGRKPEPVDPKTREQQRFDEQWRQLEAFKASQVSTTPQGPAQPNVTVQFTTGQKEKLAGLDANAINAAPVNIPIQGDVSGPSVLKTQVYLDRNNFSVGALDGRWGRNSAIATYWFQRTRGLNASGAVDEQTFRALAAGAGSAEAVKRHTLTEDDVKGPFVSIPEDVYDKEKLDCLCYESLAEKLAERFHTTIELLETLNPDVKLSELAAGSQLNVPNVRDEVTQDRGDIARVVISIKGNTFNAFDASGALIFHAPTTLGSKYDPSPRETVEVRKISHDPHFHYQPTLFHEVDDSDPEANLNPGPNSPVGVVWIALSKPHFGIHGTSDPDSIGYASSHGCVRLANWDAKEVAHRIKPGVQIEFVDTARQASQQVSGM
ncbi:MAG TPA: L,D-transpeptidase [Thermoanaerobaculia bacterium]|jgi:lipoprotein-anchoring transpeptidase ErfK/SrfK